MQNTMNQDRLVAKVAKNGREKDKTAQDITIRVTTLSFLVFSGWKVLQ